MNTLNTAVEAVYPKMVAIREHLHRHPEVGFDLPETAALVKKELDELGLEVHTGFGKTGLIGILRGGKPGKTVMLRADMDALPVTEMADVPYKSEVPGKMHACGHDGHTASLIGAAGILTGKRAELAGNIVFLFQPAEETDFGGAAAMIADGVLDIIPIDAAFATHVMGDVPLNTICTIPGVFMSSRDEFHLRLQGKGGHGAVPHQTVDPVIMAAQLILSAQTLISRRKNPSDVAVLSICQVNTPDGASNIIPDYVDMTGTLRTQSNEVRDDLIKSLEALAESITSCAGGASTFELIGGYPAVYNDPAMTDIVLAAATRVVGADNVNVLTRPYSGSEDFANFSKVLPASYALIGIKDGAPQPHHNPHFFWDHSAMKHMCGFYVSVAQEFLSS